jgi:hypothetical protein
MFLILVATFYFIRDTVLNYLLALLSFNASAILTADVFPKSTSLRGLFAFAIAMLLQTLFPLSLCQ